jgi:hypothetical protein
VQDEDGYRWVEILHQSELETGKANKIGKVVNFPNQIFSFQTVINEHFQMSTFRIGRETMPTVIAVRALICQYKPFSGFKAGTSRDYYSNFPNQIISIVTVRIGGAG